MSSSSCLGEFRVWQLLSFYQFQERIAKQKFVVSIVKPMLKLIQIGVQMLHRKLVVGADHATLKQAPNAFNGVGVNVTAHPFLFAMVDRFMARVGVAKVAVRDIIIRVDRFGFRCGVLLNEFAKKKTVWRFNDLQTNLAAPLNSPDDTGFVLESVLHVGFSAKIRFVNFDNPAQPVGVDFPHCRADAVAEIPSRFVGAIQRPLDLASRDAFLRFNHEVDRQKPFPQRQVAIVKYAVGCYRELIAAHVAVVLVALMDTRNALPKAARAFNALWPAQFGEVGAAFLIRAKTLNQIYEVYV